MKCFYHSVDLDGHCSGAIVKKKYPECEMIGLNYNDKFNWKKIKRGETVFMVDISLEPFKKMKKLNKMCNLIWIDHHITAIKEAEKNNFVASKWQRLEVGKAGCELTFEELYPNRKNETVRLLGRYDVWDHTKNVLEFQSGMWLYNTLPTNNKFWKKLLTFRSKNNVIEKIIGEGKLILEYKKQTNEKYVKNFGFETVFEGLNAICANKGMSNSLLFDSIYNDKFDILILFVFEKGMWKITLFTKKNHIDVGTIAKKYGGGGHKKAAGFYCKKLPF